MSSIKSLPWKAIRKIGFKARKLIVSKDLPDREHLVADAPLDVLEEELRKEHFRSGWFLSYHYKGEDANLSRAEYKHGDHNELQLHIRLFEREDGRTEVYPHIELCPIEHPRKHLNEEMFSVGKGVMMAKGILDKCDIPYENSREGKELDKK